MAKRNDLIDVQSLIAAKSVAEHCRLAEEYFAGLSDWTHHLSKPFGSFDETPQLLINFAIVLQGLQVCPGMIVLEFGAGTCWAARVLTQLGCKVIAVDVSSTALRMGRELYARHPPLGDRPEPEFLLFDGRRIDLPDESVERIICLDAFHHVPNPAEVLAELGRVLETGGIAGFAEPGPEHSQTAQSQFEMKKHGVIENDIDMRTIWRDAQSAGFTDLKLAVFQVQPLLVDVAQFDDFLNGGKTSRKYVDAVRAFLGNQRNFFLYKGETRPRDSRYARGLTGDISVAQSEITGEQGEPIMIDAIVRNDSPAIWLAQSAGLGAVMLGCHVRHADGSMFRESYHWEPLSESDRNIQPGETINVKAHLPGLPRGNYILEFDMVSNDVCWFAFNGSPTPHVQIHVM
jgi:SAM-dependent methyltransferase